VENKLIELYLIICHLYETKSILKEQRLNNKEQRLNNNDKPLFSDEELVTMYLFGHLQGCTTQHPIYDYIHHHWREWFSTLPTYQSFNRRFNQRTPAFELLIEQLLRSRAWQISTTDDRLIDSVPVMLAALATIADGLRLMWLTQALAPPNNSIIEASNSRVCKSAPALI
jgi:hypothetical protein